VLNFSEIPFDLDFSRAKELKDKNLHLVFSSAVRSKMDLPPYNLHVSAFEVFIAEVR
jgi:hypothetical protein